MKFQVIIADPPWSFDDKLAKMKANTRRSAESQYGVMTLNDIIGLDVASLADPDGCVLGLWVPGSFMEAGIQVYQGWGFKLKQNFVWVKTKKKMPKHMMYVDECLAFGMGRLFRQTHETAYICASGKSVYKSLEDHSQRSVCFYPNLGHSIKPQHLHASFEAMFPEANRLELFARRATPGWHCVGRECPTSLGEDIRDSISRLKSM